MSRKILVILLLSAFACIAFSNLSELSDYYCVSETYRFIDDLNDYSYVARVKYIEKDSASPKVSRFASFHKYELIDKYKGPDTGDSIIIAGGTGLNCLGDHPSPRVKGKEFIIKANFELRDKYESDFDRMMSGREELLLIFELCHENHLRIDNGIVYGNITKNKYQRSYRFNKFLKDISFGLIKRSSDKESYLQEMKMRKVERIIKLCIQ